MGILHQLYIHSYSQAVWPDLPKFHHFGHFERVHLVFYKIFKLFSLILYAVGQIFIAVNGQKFNKQSIFQVTLPQTIVWI